jgi:hypothetical protein
MQVKAKGARKITYDAFLKALEHVAAKKVRCGCAALRRDTRRGSSCCQTGPDAAHARWWRWRWRS